MSGLPPRRMRGSDPKERRIPRTSLDLVTLDVAMPPPDALEVCRRIRLSPPGPSIVLGRAPDRSGEHGGRIPLATAPAPVMPSVVSPATAAPPLGLCASLDNIE